MNQHFSTEEKTWLTDLVLVPLIIRRSLCVSFLVASIQNDTLALWSVSSLFITCLFVLINALFIEGFGLRKVWFSPFNKMHLRQQIGFSLWVTYFWLSLSIYCISNIQDNFFVLIRCWFMLGNTLFLLWLRSCVLFISSKKNLDFAEEFWKEVIILTICGITWIFCSFTLYFFNYVYINALVKHMNNVPKGLGRIRTRPVRSRPKTAEADGSNAQTNAAGTTENFVKEPNLGEGAKETLRVAVDTTTVVGGLATGATIAGKTLSGGKWQYLPLSPNQAAAMGADSTVIWQKYKKQ